MESIGQGVQSRIETLEVKNFMAIGEAVVNFDARGILTLCGYNDSGKSAITRLFEVMFYNSYSTEQTNFIRDGEEYWRGTLNFSDGVRITREKHLDGKSVWEMEKEGVLLFSNKLDNGDVASMGHDVPSVIAEYLGVIKDEQTKEKLNVRRNTDKLFLINTSGGDNYKILNAILQSDVLTEASKRIIEDKNKEVKRRISLEGERTGAEVRYEKIEVIEGEKIEEVSGLIETTTEKGKRLKRAIGVVDERQEYAAIKVQEAITEVEIEPMLLLQEVIGSRDVANKTIQDELIEVDESRLLLMREVIKRREDIGIEVQDEIKPLPLERHDEMMAVGKMYNDYYNISKNIHKIETERLGLVAQLEEMSQLYGLKMCKSCGSVV